MARRLIQAPTGRLPIQGFGSIVQGVGLRIPKEHGAWAMLLVPLVLGVAAAGAWHPRVLAVAAAAVIALTSRESLAIALRERRRGRNAGPAVRDFGLQAGVALGCGVWLVAHERLLALVPMAAAGILLLGMQAYQLHRRAQRTLTAEVLAILGLTMTAPAAYTACRGAWHGSALWLWGASVFYFSSSVFYVKLRVLALAARRNQERQAMFAATAVYRTRALRAPAYGDFGSISCARSRRAVGRVDLPAAAGARSARVRYTSTRLCRLCHPPMLLEIAVLRRRRASGKQDRRDNPWARSFLGRFCKTKKSSPRGAEPSC